MLAKVQSCAISGVDSLLVEVEVDMASSGLPKIAIVGLPDKAIEEAKDRVKAAIINSGADFPARRITINLAPSDLPKEGSQFDLPIAVGILLASGQVAADTKDSLFLGELSLNGEVRAVNGILPMLFLTARNGIKRVYIAKENALEASVFAALLEKSKKITLEIYSIGSLKELMLHLSLQNPLQRYTNPRSWEIFKSESVFDFDFVDIKGQEHSKRGMEIAAAGFHNVYLIGPPGAGKTLLCRALPSILPRLSLVEALEITKIYSVAGLLSRENPLVKTRPFRNPHHTVSEIGLVGGGTRPKPGEITLAHRGVLFLDELPQFPRNCLESLRAPLEDGKVTISRAAVSITYPSKFMLVAAQNPCPCGYYQDTKKVCQCAPSQIIKYQRKISGPLLDRFDIYLSVPRVEESKLTDNLGQGEKSNVIQARVENARKMQVKRFKNTGIIANNEMTVKEIKRYCILNSECLALLKKSLSYYSLSARSYYKVIKIARTIADLEQSEEIEMSHIAESLQFRHLEERL